MKVHYCLNITLLILILVTVACRGIGGDILFQDDFSDASSGWERVEDPNGVTDYLDGAYRIFVNSLGEDGSGIDVWANPGLEFTDVIIEVDATKVGGANNNDFGVICRYRDMRNFYFFIISSDGYYGIGKVANGVQQLIGTDAMLPVDIIRLGEANNHIRAECVGSRLSLYVNGQMVDEVSDSKYDSGDVGLLAGTYDVPGTDIYFDNFVVRRP